MQTFISKLLTLQYASPHAATDIVQRSLLKIKLNISGMGSSDGHAFPAVTQRANVIAKYYYDKVFLEQHCANRSGKIIIRF